MALFAARPKPKTRVVKPQASGLDTSMNEAAEAGGGIQPGSHPEYARGTVLGNPMKQIKGLIGKLTKPKKGSK